MATRSKLDEETAEEIMARERMVTSSSGNMDIAPGTRLMEDRWNPGTFRLDNSGDPRSIFKFNDKTEDYRSHGGGIIKLSEVPRGTAAPAGGGGGGGGGAPAASSGDWRDEVRSTANQPSQDQGKTTADILGDTYAAMTGFTPTTSGQVVNPLVNANNWVTQVDPAMQVAYNDPGIYVNPQVGMLQDSWSNTSTNPYSLLG